MGSKKLFLVASSGSTPSGGSGNACVELIETLTNIGGITFTMRPGGVAAMRASMASVMSSVSHVSECILALVPLETARCGTTLASSIAGAFGTKYS